MKIPRIFLSLLALTLVGTAPAASFHTFQAADVVLGQPDFTSEAVGLSQGRLSSPRSAARDPATGKVFIADAVNHRVLRFSSAAAAQSGSNAEAVFGQLTFTANGANQGGAASATTLSTPTSVFVDSVGRLWVTDLNNHRVLGYKNAANVAGPAPAADFVLGQPSFIVTTIGTTAAKLAEPSGVSVGPNDVLWVSDRNPNNRVLRYDQVSLKTNPATAAADGVLGQPNFTSSVGATTAAGLSSPSAVFADSSNRLWVSESINNRVVRYDAAAGKANGANADGVLGQPDFTTKIAGSTATGLNSPAGIYLDPTGNLWVSDTGNRRVARFTAAASLPNTSPAADLVLGQSGFGAPVTGTTAQQVNSAFHVAAGPDSSLLVTDGNNNRVLRFSPVPDPVVLVKGKKKITTNKARFTLKGTATNAVKVEAKVGKARYKLAKGATNWTFKAKLKTGRNKIFVHATDIYGVVSPNVKIIIIRR